MNKLLIVWIALGCAFGVVGAILITMKIMLSAVLMLICGLNLGAAWVLATTTEDTDAK